MPNNIDSMINFKQGGMAGLENALMQFKILQPEVDQANKGLGVFNQLLLDMGKNLDNAAAKLNIIDFGKQGIGAINPSKQIDAEQELPSNTGKSLVGLANATRTLQTTLKGFLNGILTPFNGQLETLLASAEHLKTGFSHLVMGIKDGERAIDNFIGFSRQLSKAPPVFEGFMLATSKAAASMEVFFSAGKNQSALLTHTWQTATAAQWTLNAAMLASPIAIITAGIGVWAIGLGIATQKTENLITAIAKVGASGLIFKALGEAMLGLFTINTPKINAAIAEVKKGTTGLHDALQTGITKSIFASKAATSTQISGTEQAYGKGIGLNTVLNPGMQAGSKNNLPQQFNGSNNNAGLNQTDPLKAAIITFGAGKTINSESTFYQPVIEAVNLNGQSQPSQNYPDKLGGISTGYTNLAPGGQANLQNSHTPNKVHKTTHFSGSNNTRNVTVSIGKLVERLEIHTSTLQSPQVTDLKRQLTDLLLSIVHDSELALGGM